MLVGEDMSATKRAKHEHDADTPWAQSTPFGWNDDRTKPVRRIRTAPGVPRVLRQPLLRRRVQQPAMTETHPLHAYADFVHNHAAGKARRTTDYERECYGYAVPRGARALPAVDESWRVPAYLEGEGTLPEVDSPSKSSTTRDESMDDSVDTFDTIDTADSCDGVDNDIETPEDMASFKVESPENGGSLGSIATDVLHHEHLVESHTLPPDGVIASTKKIRGRPRKHPRPTPGAITKPTKTPRSKTGCLTCRRRKKKCDETKPKCKNCEKNSVECEGYPERRLWRSPKEVKAEEGMFSRLCGQGRLLSKWLDRAARLNLPSLSFTVNLRPVIHGVETAVDRLLFDHYGHKLSALLTVEAGEHNGFNRMVIPLAIQHVGLMHSILALSCSHLDFSQPYGQAMLRKIEDVRDDINEDEDETEAVEGCRRQEKALEVRQRGVFHEAKANEIINEEIEGQMHGQESKTIQQARFCQMLCKVLQTIVEGKKTGEHRIHLEAYNHLKEDYAQHESKDDELMQFLDEFFHFHRGLDAIISLSPGSRALCDVNDEPYHKKIKMEVKTHLGVSKKLLYYTGLISQLRQRIRDNKAAGVVPAVDYNSFYMAAELDARIRAWDPRQGLASSSRDEDSSMSRNSVLAGLLYRQMNYVYLWRTIYQPQLHNWVPDPKLVEAVDDGLLLLERCPPTSPIQTICLTPSLIIGCAAFETEQRDRIRRCIRNVQEYASLGNAKQAMTLLERVWDLMDAKDDDSWDLQMVAQKMGLDFLAT